MKLNRILYVATLLVTLSVVGALAQTSNVDFTPLDKAPKSFRDLNGGFIPVGSFPTIEGGIYGYCDGSKELPAGFACVAITKPTVLGYSEDKRGNWVYGKLPLVDMVKLTPEGPEQPATLVIMHMATMKIVRIVRCANRFFHMEAIKWDEKPAPTPSATPCPTPPPCKPFDEPKVTEATDRDGNKIVTKDFGCGRVEIHKTATKTICEGGRNDLVGPTRSGKSKSFKLGEVLVASDRLPESYIRAIWEEMKKDEDIQKRFVKSKDDEKNFQKMLESKVTFTHVEDSFCEPGKDIRVEIVWDGWHWKEFWVGFAVGVPVGTVIGRYGIPSRPDKPQVPMKDSTSGGVRTVPNGDPVRGPIAPRDGIRTIESPLGSGTTNGDLPIGRTIGGTPPINPTTGGSTTTVPVRRP